MQGTKDMMLTYRHSDMLRLLDIQMIVNVWTLKSLLLDTIWLLLEVLYLGGLIGSLKLLYPLLQLTILLVRSYFTGFGGYGTSFSGWRLSILIRSYRDNSAAIVCSKNNNIDCRSHDQSIAGYQVKGSCGSYGTC